jgi:hypothetical protein
MRTYWEIAAGVVLSGLVLFGWWRLQKRSWPASSHDEAMRRHVNQHYS